MRSNIKKSYEYSGWRRSFRRIISASVIVFVTFAAFFHSGHTQAANPVSGSIAPTGPVTPFSGIVGRNPDRIAARGPRRAYVRPHCSNRRKLRRFHADHHRHTGFLGRQAYQRPFHMVISVHRLRYGRSQRKQRNSRTARGRCVAFAAFRRFCWLKRQWNEYF